MLDYTRKNKGFALISLIWIILGLSAVFYAGSYLVKRELRQSNYLVNDTKLLNAILGAREKAKKNLIDDNYNSFDVKIGDVFVVVKIEDEESKLNLNTATKDMTRKLKNKEYTTINSNGLININTAPFEVLLTLPNLGYSEAEKILNYNFENINELVKFIDQSVYANIANLITVKSENYKLTITANIGKQKKIVEVLLKKIGKTIQTRYWREL